MEYNFSTIEIQESTKYFKLNVDELLELKNEYGYTREECKLFDDGDEVVFFDDIKELADEQNDFNKYISNKRYTVKSIVKTINRRLAVVLIS